MDKQVSISEIKELVDDENFDVRVIVKKGADKQRVINGLYGAIHQLENADLQTEFAVRIKGAVEWA